MVLVRARIPSSAKQSGILFGDIFINNKELFIKKFTEYYQREQVEINNSAQRLLAQLNSMKKKRVTDLDSEAFTICWTDFRAKALGMSTEEKYLVMYRDASRSGRMNSISGLVDKHSNLGQGQYNYGFQTDKVYNELKSNIDKLSQSYDIEQFLQEHIDDFLTQLDAKAITPEESLNLKKYHRQYLLKKYQQQRESLAGKKWYEVFYNSSTYFSGQGLGQAYDAFMNHIANFKPQIYKFLETQGQLELGPQINSLLAHRGSVYQEEGGVKKRGNFARLLGESTNRTTWYSSGDILIIDKTNLAPLYNIQLKTTNISALSTFEIKIEQLKTMVQNFIKSETPQKKAEILFEDLLTTVSNSSEFNSLPQKTIDDMILTALKKNLGI